MADTSQFDANFFWRDYVTEDILSYCIGEVYFYHYKETLIGVRSVRENVGFFLDIATHTTGNQLYSPTLDQLTEQHIKEAVDEIDRSNEKTGYMPIGEIAPKGQELLAREMSILIDKRLTDEG